MISQTRHKRRNVNGREGITVTEAPVSQTRHRRRNVNGREGSTFIEAVISQTRHRRRNVNGREGRTARVFVNRIISITCTLNDRKVIA